MKEETPPQLLPMAGRIVVQEFDEQKTPSGIVLVNAPNIDRRSTIGKIVALPDGDWNGPDEEEVKGAYEGPLRKGDIVLFGMNSGMVVDVGWGQARRRAIILREGEILAKVIWPDGE